jgi:hypothetical protein
MKTSETNVGKKWLILISVMGCTTFQTSCSHLSSKTQNHPSWVIGLEDGTGSIKVPTGTKIFYRAIVSNANSGNSQETQDLCDRAIEKAANYLKQDYPDLTSTVPFSVEVVYPFPDEKKCAATISVKPQNLEMAKKIKDEMERLEEQKNDLLNLQTQQLADLKMQTEEEREKISSEREELEAQKFKLQKQKDYLLYLARNNQEAIVANNSIQSKIQLAQNNLKNEENLVKSVLFYGLKHKELNKLLPDIEIVATFDASSPCYKNFGDDRVSAIGKTHVCWKKYGSSYYDIFVTRYCDIESNQCWTRDYRVGSK